MKDARGLKLSITFRAYDQTTLYSHAKMIIERMTTLVVYVDHGYTVMWRQQELDTLSVLDTRLTLPVVSEIWLQVKQELNVNTRSLCELAGSVTGLIVLIRFYLSLIEGNND
ncbi:hypothetical protein MC118_003856 [Salmonella enterica]|nr:hypothetical protein [Salmonella enterica]